jgi:hypothetical protein
VAGVCDVHFTYWQGVDSCATPSDSPHLPDGHYARGNLNSVVIPTGLKHENISNSFYIVLMTGFVL